MNFKRFALSILSILIALPACSGVSKESSDNKKEPSGTSYLESLIQEGESEIHESLDLPEQVKDFLIMFSREAPRHSRGAPGAQKII